MNSSEKSAHILGGWIAFGMIGAISLYLIRNLVVGFAFLAIILAIVFLVPQLLAFFKNRTQARFEAQDELRKHREELIRQASQQPTHAKAQEARLKGILKDKRSL